MTIQKLISYKRLDVLNNKTNAIDELNLKILDISGTYLIHKDIVRHQTNKKQGTLNTKTRSEVRGGGRKPWKQKGTGRARAGSNSSPLWKGGGIIFGPKMHKRKSNLNKKERTLALQTLIYNRKDNIVVIENLEDKLNFPKTKHWIQLCVQNKINYNKKILLVVSHKTNNLKLITKNIENLDLITAASLNTFDLIKSDQILITNTAIIELQNLFI